MAPDLNSLPPSPHSPRRVASTSSRRARENMAPPIAPTSPPAQSSNILLREPIANMASGDNTGVGIGPGPLRHPRPLTAADLHMQLEKEQEAVVNRLTRELSLLRQQSASVASTASSTSTGLPDGTDLSANHLMSGVNHPTASRRHRSSSNLSTRSAHTAGSTTTGITGTSVSNVSSTAGAAGSTVSGITPARDSTVPYPYSRDPLSRQSSVASRRSEASSPSLSSSLHQGDHFPNLHTPRHNGAASYNPPSSSSQQTMSAGNTRVPSTQRYEEAAHHRSELESAKRENEALRRRIQELERSLSSHRQSGSGVTRSGSVSTNASIPTPAGTGGRSREVEEDEDAVHVGESAGSVRLEGRH